LHQNWKRRLENDNLQKGQFGPLRKALIAQLLRSLRLEVAKVHYDGDAAYIRRLAHEVVLHENRKPDATLIHLPVDAVIAMYDLHLCLEEVNLGGGLAFVLHSTLSPDHHELRLDEDHQEYIVRVSHSPSHFWAAQLRMRRGSGMLFCNGHTQGRVVPHSAYFLDPRPRDYRPRQSIEIRFFVEEPK
jgi:hypothetical protein